MSSDYSYVEEMSFSGEDLIRGMERFQKVRPVRLKGLIDLVEADYFGCTLHTGTTIGKNETSYVNHEFVLVYREYIRDEIGMLQDERVHLKSFFNAGQAHRWIASENNRTFKGEPDPYIPLGIADLRGGTVEKFIARTTYQAWDGDSLDSLIGLDKDYEPYWS